MARFVETGKCLEERVHEYRNAGQSLSASLTSDLDLANQVYFLNVQLMRRSSAAPSASSILTSTPEREGRYDARRFVPSAWVHKFGHMQKSVELQLDRVCAPYADEESARRCEHESKPGGFSSPTGWR
jgi:hypothetical protein